MAAIIGLVFVLPTFHFDIDYVQTSLLRESILDHRGNIFLIPLRFLGKIGHFGPCPYLPLRLNSSNLLN